MSRLFAYGCSFAYGQALPDIYPNNATPSKLAWPELLGQKLNREVVNRSVPGAGNLEILNCILSTKFEPTDMVVIMWSQFARHDFFRYVLLPRGNRLRGDEGELEFFKHNPIEEKWWINNNRDRNWLTIHHCSLYLQSLNLPFLSVLGLVCAGDTLPFPKLDIPNLVKDVLPEDWIIDRALDAHGEGGGHPGVESHRLITDLLYDRIEK